MNYSSEWRIPSVCNINCYCPKGNRVLFLFESGYLLAGTRVDEETELDSRYRLTLPQVTTSLRTSRSPTVISTPNPDVTVEYILLQFRRRDRAVGGPPSRLLLEFSRDHVRFKVPMPLLTLQPNLPIREPQTTNIFKSHTKNSSLI